MKRFFSLLISLMLLAGLAGCDSNGTADTPGNGDAQGGGELNILTWEGYIPDDVVKAFEEETGIKVNYASANDNESMLSRLQADQGSYDILIISDYIVGAMIENQLLKELDKSKLPNFSNLDEAYLGQAYDPDNKYTIPYAPSIAILAYDTEALDFEPTGYEDLWRPELENSIVLLDGDRDIIGLTLQTLGYSLNDTDPDHLAEAQEKLLELKANVIGFDANTPHNMLISGEAKMGYMFGSQITAAMAEKESISFAYPKEGLGLYVDCVVMAEGAPNEENAYKLIDYILDGKNSAAISNLIFYTNCNKAAQEFLSEAYKANETINIPAAYLNNIESYSDLGEATQLYTDVWTVFKSY